MSNSEKRLLTSLTSGAIGGFLVILLAIGTVVAYPATASAIMNRIGTLSPSGAVNPVTPSAADVNRQTGITEVVKRVDPAVVSITLTKSGGTGIGNAFDPFQQFFGTPSPFGQQVQTPAQSTPDINVGGGTGFLISSDGYIVTNRHVVDTPGIAYTVTTSDGKTHPAKIIGSDAITDIAIVKIDGTNYPYLTFSDSNNAAVGQTVIAIGNALAEFQNTVSVGVVSGLSRTITAGNGQGTTEQLDQLIQTDAAINPGNSGGPLLDLSGQVIGVNVAVANAQNIGFAIPSNTAKNVADALEKTGKVTRAYMGVRYTPVSGNIQAQQSLHIDYGALVSSGSANQPAVVPGSPAAQAGIVENDVILKFDGTTIDQNHTLASLIATKNVGDTVTLTILHNGQEKTVQVKLGEHP